MSELTHKMINYARILRKRIAELEVIKESAPDGTLRLRKVSNNTHYSHRVSEIGKRRELYLSSDKQDIIMSLAEKKYACDVIPILKKNLAAAEVFLSMHSGKDENDVANLINDEY
ncbi:MAG: hypothetical protein J5824_03275, partial [Lachnospiraceae bacterium]|nr:hypothetical protein [Lachnospiraceae bacterium]